ncbi:hypothetical protein AU468_02315 [Alkalispirochaeta sphaeroplastigenens]|uniref:PAS domain-containing protein n=2 Tax=Alkalispirochaeta sphaeroplastigenens TaxID=1187066 RepID=A0A2S4K0B3_9SPIO|nr:hypothetical protein AU468_02315 [Alkalispirochaeta sphaeroplastigenens]
MVGALIVVSLVATILLGGGGWWFLAGAGDTDPAVVKIVAERLLLAGFLAAVLVILTAAIVLKGAVDLEAALARLAELNQRSPATVKQSLHRLGDVGSLIMALLRDTERISAQKSTRISAMNALLGVLVVRSPRRFLVVYPDGRVYRASPPALESLGKSLSEVIDQPVETVIPEESFARVQTALERSPDIYAFTGKFSEITVLPVPNNQGQTAYYFYDLEGRRESALQELLQSLR